MRLSFLVLALTTLPLLPGCVPMLEREVRVHQGVQTDIPDGTFEIDTSAIPKEWILETTTTSSAYSQDITNIKLDARHPVKILIVPR